LLIKLKSQDLSENSIKSILDKLMQIKRNIDKINQKVLRPLLHPNLRWLTRFAAPGL